MRGNGFLAIWSDVEPDQWTDYLHWLTREHTSERIGTAGFLGVRVFRALGIEAMRVFIRRRSTMDAAQHLSRTDGRHPCPKPSC